MLIIDAKKFYHTIIKRGLNFSDLARGSNLALSTIMRILDADRPVQNKTAKKIADALNVPISRIVKEDCT